LKSINSPTCSVYTNYEGTFAQTNQKSCRPIKILNFNSELQIRRFKSEIFRSIYRILSDAVDRPRPSQSDVPIGRSGFKNHQQYYVVKKKTVENSDTPVKIFWLYLKADILIEQFLLLTQLTWKHIDIFITSGEDEVFLTTF
jgi:hypothetical protein